VASAAAIGYGLAAWAYWAAGFPPHAPFWLLRTLVPVVNLRLFVPVDPDLSEALGLWAPANALLYGLIGLVASKKIVDRMVSAE
jgi:hypothetical protein